MNDYYIKTRIVCESYYKVKAGSLDEAKTKADYTTMAEMNDQVPMKSYDQVSMGPNFDSQDKYLEIEVDVENEDYEIFYRENE